MKYLKYNTKIHDVMNIIIEEWFDDNEENENDGRNYKNSYYWFCRYMYRRCSKCTLNEVLRKMNIIETCYIEHGTYSLLDLLIYIVDYEQISYYRKYILKTKQLTY